MNTDELLAQVDKAIRPVDDPGKPSVINLKELRGLFVGIIIKIQSLEDSKD